MSLAPLNAASLSARAELPARPPVRIVHLGLGAFHRAHQAWYTAHASDADGWGIAAFTGRSPHAAQVLSAQDGFYTLTTRGPERDDVEIVTSIVEAHDGADVAALADLLVRPEVAIVTLTVTEAGYDAQPGQDSPLRRLLHGLEARRSAHAGPLAIVPCDNVPANGTVVRERLSSLARDVSPLLVDWLDEQVSFVSTSVDRITPRWEGTPVPAVEELGWDDAAPVITEPFSSWVLEGDFPGGRPQWEDAGAVFVQSVEHYEHRKLWLLNGAHSILAWSGLRRGLVTVAQATADAECRALVHDFWEEAARHLPEEADTARYCRDLEERFANARMEYRLAQIATDSANKWGARLAAVARRERDAGREARACAAGLAQWVLGLSSVEPLEDVRNAEVAAATQQADPVTALVSVVDAPLAQDHAFVSMIKEVVTRG